MDFDKRTDNEIEAMYNIEGNWNRANSENSLYSWIKLKTELNRYSRKNVVRFLQPQCLKSYR